MSAGDGREGVIRSKASRGRLGGKLAGLTLPQQIRAIAFWPFLEQVLNFVVTTSDQIFATRLGNTPNDTIAIADGMGAVVFLVWFGFVMQGSIMMGATAIIARMTGARKFNTAQDGLIQASILGFIAGGFSCLLMYTCSDWLMSNILTMSDLARSYAMQYMRVVAFVAPFSGVVFAINASLRGSGDTRLPFWIMLNVSVVNVLFCFIFVYSGFGLAGIAGSTIIGFSSSLIILVTILFKRHKKLFGNSHDCDVDQLCLQKEKTYTPPLFFSHHLFKWDFSMQKRILKVGIPQAIEVFGIWGIQMFCLSIISKLSIPGALGVHNIAIRIESLSFLPGFAIGMASSTLVGQYLGARNTLLARITIWKCLKYAVIFMSILGVLFFVFPSLWISIFTPGNEAILQSGTPVLRTMLLVEPVFAACIIMKMSLRGAGDTKRVMIISYVVMSFFRMLVPWLWFTYSPSTISLWGIWLLFAFEMFIQTIIFYRIIKGDSWTKLQI